MQASRYDRNQRLVARLRQAGFDIRYEEVHEKGRKMAGRPHFAQVLLEKGYVKSIQEAFDKYLDVSSSCYVDRLEPQLELCIAQVRAQGGITSLAHPVRIKGNFDQVLPRLCGYGLDAIEVCHSDHTSGAVEMYLRLAQRYKLAVTGGSDFTAT